MSSPHPVHPLGTKARVLLSSVFGPYAQDDEYGSRSLNPMELYHNQVTRVQGGFSLRMFHRSFGLMLLQANIDAPCTLLDFPTLDRFVEEIRRQPYEIVGISSILPNFGKVKKMCELVRQHLPQATIVVGGHVANKPGIDELIDADHIVRGDGVRWFRQFLSQDTEAAVRHPAAYSGFGARVMGINLPQRPGSTAAILLPSAGCPVGCNFCSTSAMFGGKGRFINFYETGDELFSVMSQLEQKLRVRSFFIMDENFLLHRKRALRLLELMEDRRKSWSLYVFSSARVLQAYTIEQLVRLGISWAWLGLEGEHSQYHKLRGVDTKELVRTLQSHGIRVLGSTIIGLEQHTPENIDRAISHAVSHGADFHQFMLYTPVAGTPLYEQHRKEGTLLPESASSIADTHGQFRFNYRHTYIREGREEEFILRAFRRDYQVNGPSLARMARTLLKGWRRYKNHPDERIRDRYAWEASKVWSTYAGLVWAAKKWLRGEDLVVQKMASLLGDIHQEFGWKSRIATPLLGRFFYSTLKREEKRLARGWTYEPPTFYELNARALALQQRLRHRLESRLAEIQWVTGEPSPAPSR
ncbi:MAG: B12-binding domain-containing radical SAM protein [Acidobacteriota bacterium]